MNPSDVPETPYPFIHRDPPESSRLNNLHTIYKVLCNGHLIHPLLPLSGITTVADIATGNGSWLEDIHAKLSPLTSTELRLDGFDIASGLFPEHGKGTYVVQDITKSFPLEYHGTYDLVHIRFLTVALPADKYLAATENVVKLLKPGGYIQWEEADVHRIHFTPHGPIHEQSLETFCRATSALGMSQNPVVELQEAFKDTGLQIILTEARNAWWYDETKANCQQFYWQVWDNPGILNLLVWGGQAQDKDAAEAMVKRFLQGLEQEIKAGVIPNFPIRLILGRKPL